MSRTPYFFVERYNFNTKKYELEHPIIWDNERKNQEIADLYPYNGSHEMFSIVEDQGDYPNMRGVHYGMPEDAHEYIKAEYKKYGDDERFCPTVRWFTYADLMIYLMKYPEVEDFDSDKEGATTRNPMFALDERIRAFMEVVDGWDWEDAALIRIVYWIS